LSFELAKPKNGLLHIYIYDLQKAEFIFINVTLKESFFGLVTLQDQKMNSLEEKKRKNKNKIYLKQIKFFIFWSCKLSKLKKRFLDKKRG
jgi:hypothetical protein